MKNAALLSAVLAGALSTAAAAQTAAVPPAPSPAGEAPGAVTQANDEMLHLNFTCAEGGPLDVVFVNTAGGTSFAVVGGPDGLIPMAQAVSASGAVYSAEVEGRTIELLTKGREASLSETMNGKETWLRRDCVAPD